MAALVRGGRIRGDKKNGGSGGVVPHPSLALSPYRMLRHWNVHREYDPPALWDQVHTLENMVPAPTTIGQPPRKDPQTEYSKIVPQSEQKYR
ncbi:hypothetical protein Tco_0729842 [Tanacetum coccineum]|uniref:Uncharacterized protein n=1 Tax=Tanacetum coccineum TaxID=301880 RepID=A0ABQ4YR99_9ASTR